MRKKTIRLFYSWQDDTDNKINRSFIKNCLDSALAEINKKSEIDEALRPQIELDHDTKGIPGIPDIANTILQKISSADIFVADLTFVSDYQNHKGVVKKVSNQNVIFELGFAFNVLGPSKIIYLFNEAFGQPKDLIFDLQHRRWPILFNLAASDSAEKGAEKSHLKQKLNTAIVSILNSPSIKKDKLGLHTPFSPVQHEEFEYLYKKLGVPIAIQLKYRETIDHRKYFMDAGCDWRGLELARQKPWQQKFYSLKFLPVLIGFIALGKKLYLPDEFNSYVHTLLKEQHIFPDSNEYDSNYDYNEDDLELLLRTLGLISGEGRFSQKVYKMIHWLVFNGYNEALVTVEEV